MVGDVPALAVEVFSLSEPFFEFVTVVVAMLDFRSPAFPKTELP